MGSWLSMMIRLNVVVNRTVVDSFDNLAFTHSLKCSLSFSVRVKLSLI